MFLECRHIRPTGVRCKSPALRGQTYCYFHSKLRHHAQDGSRATKEPLLLPSLEDDRGIQIAVSQILSALGSGRLDARLGGLYLYGMQIASQLARRVTEIPPQLIVRNVTCDDAGEPLALESTACEPFIDCNTCPENSTCIDETRINMRSAQQILRSIRDGQNLNYEDAQPRLPSGPDRNAE